MIHIWEVLDGKKGELWQTIEYDLKKPSSRDNTSLHYDLKCLFRLPNYGIFEFPGKEDNESVSYAYALPALKIRNYMAGKLQDPVPETKIEWEALPKEKVFDISNGPITIQLSCKKDIVDPLEHSIEGYYYIYRPDRLSIMLKK